MDTLSHLVLEQAPPLDPAWLQHEEKTNLEVPKKVYASALERQPVYAEDCRLQTASMLAPGAAYHHLSRISAQNLEAASSIDSTTIPIIRFFDAERGAEDIVIVYFHGGGLYVGEADSEELSCRRMVYDVPGAVVYSVGYRLMPAFPASTCVADVADGFAHVRTLHPAKKIVLVGSSSGGQLAATVSQLAPKGSLKGVVLRCPVTSDGGSSLDFVPPRFRSAYTSVSPTFETSLLGALTRAVTRDGLDRLPLEIETDELQGLELPRTWIQVCSNDTLYSDGVCYAMALKEAGVDVRVEVVKGWPHTFWLKAPWLEAAEAAEREMIEGLRWVLEG